MERRQSKLSENCKTKSAQKQWCEDGLTDRRRLDSKDFEKKRRNSSFQVEAERSTFQMKFRSLDQATVTNRLNYKSRMEQSI